MFSNAKPTLFYWDKPYMAIMYFDICLYIFGLTQYFANDLKIYIFQSLPVVI